VFAAPYALIPYIKQIGFVFKGLISVINNIPYIFISYSLWMGAAVAQLVEALSYKPEGRGFDSL
jgi:hypothetical protein